MSRLFTYRGRSCLWDVQTLRIPLLGGSWVVKSRVIGRITILIIHITGLITPLITTHEPPSSEPQKGGT